MRQEWKKDIFDLNSKIFKADSISIIMHYNPDGDALGAAMALYLYLKSKSLNVHVISPNSFPDFLNWLPGVDNVINAEKKPELARTILSSSDYIYCLDFNHSDRIKELENSLLSSSAVKVMIDHHPEPQSFCQVLFSDTKASSTAELVYNYISISEEETKLSKDIATAIYTGLMTDTGNFSYNCSNPATFRVVAELLESGINKDEITSNIFDNFSADRMMLLGLSLKDRMTVIPEFNTAFIALSRKDLYKYNFSQGDSEGFVNLPLSIKGIKFSALFIEHKDFVKISFRSKGSFAANKFSEKHFNGGGHRNAAGGNSSLSFKLTLEKFKDLLPEFKDELVNHED